MRRLYQKLRSRMTLKLLLVSIMTSVIPLVIIWVVITIYLYNSDFNKAIESSARALQDKVSGVDEKLDGLLSLSVMALTNNDLRQLMKLDNEHLAEYGVQEIKDNYKLYQNYVLFREFFNTANILTPEIADITLITSREVYFAFRDYQILSADFTQEYQEAEWYKSARENPYTPIITGKHLPYQSQVENLEVITVIRPITDYIKDEYLGTLLIDAKTSIFASFINNDDDDQGGFFLVDGNGEVILSGSGSINLPADLMNSVVLTGDAGCFFYNDNSTSTEYILNYCRCKNSDWVMLHLLPRSPLIAKSISSTFFIILLFCGVALMMICGTIFIASSFTKPLGIIADKLIAVGNGNLEIEKSAYDGRRDEVGQLMRVTNTMKKNLKDMIQKLSSAMSRERDAQMQALQSQINPHFIYNTLNIIQMTAKLNHDDEVVYLLENLGLIFKSYIRINRSFVTLDEELSLIKTYVNIQRARYSSGFGVDYDINLDAETLLCPKFMLQPIIENCITHGFNKRQTGGQIVISAFIKEDVINIRIADNGKGIQKDTLLKLQKKLLSGPEANDEDDSVGLINVNERLKLHFGDEHGLRIDSIEHIGTTVNITMPAVCADANYEYNTLTKASYIQEVADGDSRKIFR